MLRHLATMKIRLSIFTLVLLASPVMATSKATYIWNQLADGLYYTNYSLSQGEGERSSIYAFQIDPKKFRVDVVTAVDEQAGGTAEELAVQRGAILVINGGFFTTEHRSIGLMISGGKELRPLHKTSWWSIFAMRGDTPTIFSPKEFTHVGTIHTALQAGPRLVIDGRIPQLKEGTAARSAIGIRSDGNLVIAITQGQGISLNELARRMSATRLEGGLECPNAMALDGGSSSQLYAKVGKFNLSLSNIARITNGLAVFEKRGNTSR